MSKKKKGNRYDSSLDSYDIKETSPGEVIISSKMAIFSFRSAIDLGIMYARLTKKNVTIEVEIDKPYLKITPRTTADQAIKQYCKYDKGCSDGTIACSQKEMQLYLKSGK